MLELRGDLRRAFADRVQEDRGRGLGKENERSSDDGSHQIRPYAPTEQEPPKDPHGAAQRNARFGWERIRQDRAFSGQPQRWMSGANLLPVARSRLDKSSHGLMALQAIARVTSTPGKIRAAKQL